MAISIWVSIYNFYKSYTSKSPRRKEIKGKNSAEKEEADKSNFPEKNTPVENIINETTFSEPPEIINLPPQNAPVENIEDKTEIFEPSEINLLPLKEVPLEDRKTETELSQPTEIINSTSVSILIEHFKETSTEVGDAEEAILSPLDLPIEKETSTEVGDAEEAILPLLDLPIEETSTEVGGTAEAILPSLDLPIEQETIEEAIGEDTQNVMLQSSPITEGVQEDSSTIDDVLESSKDKQEEFVTVEHEMATIQKYLASEKHDLGEKLDYSLDIEAESLNYKIPIRIIQSLVENALKQNIEQIAHTFYLHIQSFVYDGFLTIEIKFSNQPTETISLAIDTIEDTVKKLALQFGENGFFNVENDGENDIVATICVPVMS